MNDSATAFAAIAFDAGDARERALDHLEAGLATNTRSTSDVPFDDIGARLELDRGRRSAGSTPPHARSWRCSLLRPGAPAIDDGIGMLRDRETVGGGWNYGNRVVLGEDLEPYAQTTAAAMVALQGADAALERRAASLRCDGSGARSVDGALTVALATAALRLHGDDDAGAVRARALRRVRTHGVHGRRRRARVGRDRDRSGARCDCEVTR